MAGTLGVTGVITGGGLVVPDGSIAVADLDIDGATDIGAAIVDADLMIVDDGAGGTNRKATMTRLATYMGTKGLGPAYTRSATAPGSPNAGDWWYNTTSPSLYIYDGTVGWLNNTDRTFGKGTYIAPNTFSLLARIDGSINKIRYEPEATMTLDKSAPVTHTFTSTASSMQAVSNASRGVFTKTKTTTNAYAYVTLITNGEASSFGNSNALVNQGSGCDHATRGVFAGGAAVDDQPSVNHMEYITIASAGNGTDFGNLTTARRVIGCQAMANTTRGIFAGGYTSSASNVMDYITIASAGNATDFGNLTAADYNHTSANSIVRGLIFSGESSRTQAIDYITIASAGNAADFGDHLTTTDANDAWVVHNKLYAYYSRHTASTQEKHTIATAANATAFSFSNAFLTTQTYTKATIKGWISASG
tara:strand:- start:80 stop:1339 length:1260 start_codon:yes stop_codon:yes gene_type:complete